MIKKISQTLRVKVMLEKAIPMLVSNDQSFFTKESVTFRELIIDASDRAEKKATTDKLSHLYVKITVESK